MFENGIFLINFYNLGTEVTNGLTLLFCPSFYFFFALFFFFCFYSLFVTSASNPHWCRINKLKEKAAPSTCQRQIPWHQSTGTQIMENPFLFQVFNNQPLLRLPEG